MAPHRKFTTAIVGCTLFALLMLTSTGHRRPAPLIYPELRGPAPDGSFGPVLLLERHSRRSQYAGRRSNQGYDSTTDLSTDC
jgi:hypothetical protein